MILILPSMLSLLMYVLFSNELLLSYGLFLSIILLLNSVMCSEIWLMILISVFCLIWINIQSQKIIGVIIYIAALLCIQSTGLISLFISIEMLSLSVVILINLYIQEKHTGILYYLFSGLFSALFLLGIAYSSALGNPIGYILIYISLWFKIGLSPFHLLLPKLYTQLSPTIIILIDIPYKLVLWWVLYRFYVFPIDLSLLIILCLLTGAISSIGNTHLMNILIYSSINNYGLLLISLILQKEDYFIFYLTIYSCLVFIYLQMITFNHIPKKIMNNYYICIWTFLIFNLIGIPPFAGFFMKYFILSLLIENKLIILFIIILISVFIISYIYLRILVSMLLGPKEYHLKYSKSGSAHLISSLITVLSIPFYF